jgi:hypothetical protein
MIKQETFKSTVKYLTLENSFGVIATSKNVELEVTVGIKSEDYGWFELYDTKSEGDAWYAEGSLEIEGKSIVGYDGVFSLSEPVIDKLKEWGYNTDEVE